MINSEVKKYACALYKVALHQNNVELVNKNILSFKEEFNKISTSVKHLDLCILSKNHQFEVLKIILDSINAHKIWRDFIFILVNRNSVHLLEDFLNNWDELSKEFDGYEKIVVITAEELLEEQENRIISHLKKSLREKFFIEKKIDPTIIGGLIVRAKNFEFNDSILGRLNNISKNIKGELLNE